MSGAVRIPYGHVGCDSCSQDCNQNYRRQKKEGKNGERREWERLQGNIDIAAWKSVFYNDFLFVGALKVMLQCTVLHVSFVGKIFTWISVCSIVFSYENKLNLSSF